MTTDTPLSTPAVSSVPEAVVKKHQSSPPISEPISDNIPLWGLPFYLFVEPLCLGRVVLDLSPTASPGPELLKRAGAIEVLRGDLNEVPLPFPSAGADLILLGLSTTSAIDDQARFFCLSEIRRILRPGGFAVIRVSAESLISSDSNASLRALLADRLLQQFSTVEIVEETPFQGVSFFAAGCEELAVSEAMARLSGNPSFLIALCSDTNDRPWHISESLLVPTNTGEETGPSTGESAIWRTEISRLSQALADITYDRDNLREERMNLQDRADRLGKMVSNLRKDIERYLRQGSEYATQIELLAIERDQLGHKHAKESAEVARLIKALDAQASISNALEKEVARLRAARGER